MDNVIYYIHATVCRLICHKQEITGLRGMFVLPEALVLWLVFSQEMKSESLHSPWNKLHVIYLTITISLKLFRYGTNVAELRQKIQHSSPLIEMIQQLVLAQRGLEKLNSPVRV